MVRIVLCLLLLMGAAAWAEEAATGDSKAMSDCGEEPASAESERGAWFFDQACRHCHGPPTLVRSRIPGATVEEKTAWLDSFLPRHHCAPDDAMRAALIAYLLGN